MSGVFHLRNLEGVSQSDNGEIVLLNIATGRVVVVENEERASMILGQGANKFQVFKRCRPAEKAETILEKRRAMYYFGKDKKGSNHAESESAERTSQED